MYRLFVVGWLSVVLLTQGVIPVLAALTPSPTGAPPLREQSCEPLCAFSHYVVVTPKGLVVPSVVEYTLPDTWVSGEVVVSDDSTNELIPSLVQTKTETIATPITVYAEQQPLPSLSDGRLDTNYTFGVRPDMTGRAALTVRADQAVTVSAIRLALAENVILPRSVSVAVLSEEGEETVILAPVPMGSDGVVRFPVTTARDFYLTLTHTQPLRISEVSLYEKDPTTDRQGTVRFLARPGGSYRLYLDPDRAVSLPVGESPNLTSDKDVRRFSLGALTPNPDYVPADQDRDGVVDVSDNCVSVPNADQLDIDGNGVGDVCDDFDRDGFINSVDNCPQNTNRTQSDEDGDGIGDACDEAESRFTEQYAWIPWVGMGMVLVVLIGLLALTVRK